MIKYREKAKLRCSQRRGILEEEDIIIITLEEISLIRHHPRGAQLVNSLFKEHVYQILEKIKNKPYFKWPNKMGGDSFKRNQSLFCHYHQDRGYTTEDCKSLSDHLNHLMKVRKLNQFLHQHRGRLGIQELGSIRMALLGQFWG